MSDHVCAGRIARAATALRDVLVACDRPVSGLMVWYRTGVPVVNRLPVDYADSGKQFTATIYRCGGSAGLASNAHRLPVSFRLLKTAKTPVAFSRYEFKRLTVKLTKFMAGIKTIQITCIFAKPAVFPELIGYF